MQQVAEQLRTMPPEQLGAMVSATGQMLRSADEAERTMGALLRVQLLSAIYDEYQQ
jgi:hypothetical protein